MSCCEIPLQKADKRIGTGGATFSSRHSKWSTPIGEDHPHLLGITNRAALSGSTFEGAVYESFVAAEIVKHRLNRGLDRGLYYFRDRQGLEVDFLLDQGNNRVALIEVKATRTPMPRDAGPMRALMRNMSERNVSAFLAHKGETMERTDSVLCPGVKAVGITELDGIL